MPSPEAPSSFEDLTSGVAEVCGRELLPADLMGNRNASFQSVEWLRAVADHAPVLIAYLDAGQRYQFANETFRAWLGVDPASMIGKTVEEVFGRTAAERAQERMARVLTGETVHFQTSIQTGNEARDVEATYVPDRDAAGTVRGFYLTVQDITAQENSTRALRELTALQVAILDSANLAIVATDLTGIIWTFNSTAERWLGYRVEEIIGRRTMALFLDAAEMETRRRELEPALGKPGATFMDWVLAVVGDRENAHDEREWMFVRKDGSRFPVAFSLTVLRGGAGEPTGILGIARDIAVEKSAEAARRQAQDATERASQAKARFFANMTHEVRTPLHGILGVMGMLLESPLDASQRPLAEIVHSSTQALLAVVSRVLDFSKIEAGKLMMDAVDFSPARLLRDVTQLHRIRAEEKGVVLKCEVAENVPEWVCGDSDRLRQVVHNLVGNAIKFSSAGTVQVGVALADGEAGRMRPSAGRWRLRFSVQDEGIGIPPEAQSRIFEPFVQADESIARCFGGTGLGLAIARQLVELMGGELTVKSAPGFGSTFSFTAAFAPRGGTANDLPKVFGGERLQPPTIPFRRLRVLLVDDSEVNRRIAQHQIDHSGCDLTVADNGRRAVEAVARENFDLIFMDCQMPEMDGYAATAEIRRRENGADWRAWIVALTAQASPEERTRGLAVGMDELLLKPFQPAQLASVVRVARSLLRPPSDAAPVDPADLAALRKASSTTESLFGRLIAIFQREALEAVAAALAAVESGEIAALEIAVHKLKGAAGNFGAHRLQQLCQVAEDLCRGEEVRFIRWLLPEIAMEVRLVLDALHRAS